MFSYINPGILLLLGIVALLANAKHHMTEEEKEQMAKDINSKQHEWTASAHRHRKSSANDKDNEDFYTGELPREGPPKFQKKSRSSSSKKDLPENFDSRTKWPDCPSISSIKNQGPCGSCYAVSTSAVFSDRLCIASKGDVKVNISAEYIINCCTSCGNGCHGGKSPDVLEYFHTHGDVTGGDYESDEGCQPYSRPHHEAAACTPDECTNDDYDVPFYDDLHYCNAPYHLGSVDDVKEDIFENGPVLAAFNTYEDFHLYEKGVYRHIEGNRTGRHAVRLIGWGVTDDDDKFPYWIVANSYGRNWGENGILRIHRGTDECGFEEDIYGCIPDLSRVGTTTESS